VGVPIDAIARPLTGRYKMAKPRYIDPVGAQPLVKSVTAPPFTFQGVTCRAFPLRANMARLTKFCDSYLNMDVPQDIVYFRPALPYVYLMVLNYGGMAPSSVQAQNFGGWRKTR
jgi:hypothetical protein